jgi:hypothetical protein
LNKQLPSLMAHPNLEMLKKMSLAMKEVSTDQIWVLVKKKKRKLNSLQPSQLVKDQLLAKGEHLLIKTLLQLLVGEVLHLVVHPLLQELVLVHQTLPLNLKLKIMKVINLREVELLLLLQPQLIIQVRKPQISPNPTIREVMVGQCQAMSEKVPKNEINYAKFNK